jgi:hypothetical protein
VVRMSWLRRHNGRHRLSRFGEEVRRAAQEEHAGLQLQVDDLRDAVTALQPASTAHGAAADIPPELAAALAAGHRDGQALVLDIGGEEVIAVVGNEGGDPAAVWGFLRQIAS